MDDASIIDLFWGRSEDAIGALDRQYGPAPLELSLRIVGNASDAEACLNDADLGVSDAIPPQRPEHLLSYVKRVVRKHSMKRYHKNTGTTVAFHQ